MTQKKKIKKWAYVDPLEKILRVSYLFIRHEVCEIKFHLFVSAHIDSSLFLVQCFCDLLLADGSVCLVGEGGYQVKIMRPL